MKKVMIYGDSTWAIGRIHKDIEKYLCDEFEFIYYDWSNTYSLNLNEVFESVDLVVSMYMGQKYFDNYNPLLNKKKCIFISYGFEEMHITNPSPSSIYGMASRSIEHLFPSNLKPFFVPICVELDNFNHKKHSGSTNVVGWCGAPRVWFKQFHWAREIAKQFGTELQVSSKTQFEDLNDGRPLSAAELKVWYSKLDILLITSIPNWQSETGPLPAFEAIASGVVVIGTSVGNFMEVPGPKFATIEEAVHILNDLKQNPEKVKQIAKEQYKCIVNKWNYNVVSEQWKEMFRAALKNAEST
jgi:glycosyltransferase involved in cell wall biosynthesis